ncbi:MAG: hypothetical protein ABJN26_21945 [Stappiaceae bacterium]
MRCTVLLLVIILVCLPFQSKAEEETITYRTVPGLKGLITCPQSVPPYSLSESRDSSGKALRQCRYNFGSVAVIVSTYRKPQYAQALKDILGHYRASGYSMEDGYASAVLGTTYRTYSSRDSANYETIWSLSGSHHDYIVWASYRLPTHKQFIDDIYRKFLVMIRDQQG